MFDLKNTELDGIMKKGVVQTQLVKTNDYFCAGVQKTNGNNMGAKPLTEEDTMMPYTVEELKERAEEGRRQIALGNYSDIDDVLQELDEDLQMMQYENQG